MRLMLGFVTMAALAACAPAIPDSGAGVGFGDYDTYQRKKAAREAELSGEYVALPPPDAISSQPLDATGGATEAPAAPEMSEADRIAAEARAALDVTVPEDGAGDEPLQASPSNPPPAVVNDAGISQENSFDAVGSERSIEEDAARIARNRAQYQVIEPEEIGTRPGDVGPNIVDYALATTHPVGTGMYRRFGIATGSRHERNCAEYASPDQAQLDFLRKGGPERDRMALDPDGDGYACGWDPSPYRRALRE
ncbi:hypothetical protein [Roseovarius ramblicola]|uniref:Excalibur calcium-binding domain-containing protein n=1 Tax=Roseovarius ramblicola TaxID=2022336 RepID=A0ABV5HUT9_9RHOB